MKYTKNFEKYWKNKKDPNFKDLEEMVFTKWEWEHIKKIAFRAWKAGIEKTKRDSDLIKPRDESSKFLYF